jgi:hypothetical protein
VLSPIRTHAQHFYALIDTFINSLSGPMERGYVISPVSHISQSQIYSVNGDTLYPSTAYTFKYTFAVVGHEPLIALGFNMKVFEKFGEHLVDAMLMTEIIQTCPEGKRAWMRFIAYAIDFIRSEVGVPSRNECNIQIERSIDRNAHRRHTPNS